MEIKRTKDYKGFEIEIKRFYVPFVISTKCKGCGEVIEEWLGNDYLSYPTLGEPFNYVIYHGEKSDGEECDTENVVKLQLDMQVTVVEEN